MNLYLIGIAGAGMHSLALYLYESGHHISGSDTGASCQTLEFWRERGVKVYTEQSAENIDGAELVIYSAAVPPTNPERAAAEQRGCSCSRGEALARFANEHGNSIAVCGTHGKGTTAAAISLVLHHCGKRVSDILGAVPIGRMQPALYTPHADCLICEVDESDKTNCFHRPAVLLINNIEADHLNVYRDLNDIVNTFEQHIRACIEFGSHIILHYSGVGAPILYEQLKDCRQIDWVAPEGVLDMPALAYEISEPDQDGHCKVTMRAASGEVICFRPELGGRANAQNLVSAAAFALYDDIPLEKSSLILAQYQGLRDRCEIQDIDGKYLVTDYASHPTCIQNDIEWLRPRAKRIIALYHPYRYSLMQCHWDALVQSLSNADEVYILPFDPCGEPRIEGISSPDLANKIIQNHTPAKSFDTFGECFKDISKSVNKGDLLIVFAGGPAFIEARQALMH